MGGDVRLRLPRVVVAQPVRQRVDPAERPLDTPNLAADGFTLVGGRLLPPIAESGTGPAAQLMYQNQTADRLTVYITAAGNPPGRPFENYAENGLEAYYWADSQITRGLRKAAA